MKFLVLALCVCAASAASLGSFGKPTYQPYPTQAFAKVFVQNTPQVPVVPVAYTVAKTIVEAPVVAARTTYIAGKDAKANILRSETDVKPYGFDYFYETSNGIAGQASGIPKKVGNDEVLTIQGSYKYTDDNGKEVLLTYVADENGYQPQSASLPVGPAIPDYILRSLEYNRINAKPETN